LEIRLGGLAGQEYAGLNGKILVIGYEGQIKWL
jgi:hypothetical protein